MFGRIANKHLNIFLITRDRHAQRLDLKDAGVGAIEGAGQVIEEKLAVDDATEIVADALALCWIHAHPSLRPFRRLKLLAPYPLLPVTLRSAKLKRSMFRARLATTVFSLTAVADDHIAYPEIK